MKKLNIQNISLRSVYIIVFSILAAWALFGYITMHSLIQSQQQYAKIINISGKQRMLSQRIALMAVRYFESSDERFLNELQELLKMMRDDHAFIIQSITSESIRKLYYKDPNINAKVKNFHIFVDVFIKDPSIINLQMVQLYSSDILPDLNEAVYAFEDDSNEKTDALSRRENFILIGTLLTLLLEAVFLVQPMVRIVARKEAKLKGVVERRTKRLELFLRIFENALEGMMVTDENGKIITVNKSFTNITGFSSKEVIGKTPRVLRSGKQDEAFYKQMWNSLKSDGHWKGEIVNKTKSGILIYEWLSIIKYHDAKADKSYYISIFYDITGEHQAKEHLAYVANHDYLTKLPNRNLFHDRMEHALQNARRNSHKVALIFIDLDDFKVINDTLGHDKGDALLQVIAKRLIQHTREADTVARIGGDEFVIIIEELDQEEDLSHFLTEIIAVVSKPVQVESNKINISCSVGVSVYPQDSDDAQTLIRYADTAMYNAKELGKNRFSFFTQKLNEKVTRRLEIESQLRSAVQNDELQLYLQPKIDILEQKIIGAEGLLRWKSERLGEVSPAEFIPLSEQSNQIQALSQWVLQKGSAYMNRWAQDDLMKNLTLALNVSAKQFDEQKDIDALLNTLETFSHKDKAILEITESMLLQDSVISSKVLEKIDAMGIHISVDDFGTGYSSLAYLRHLPIHSLKIDRAFIADMLNDNGSIVKTILILAKSLGLSVVAEGVETQGQYEFLFENRVHEVQGFYYAPALPLDEFEDFVKKF